MTTFVDTSALYALLDEDDNHHERAASWLGGPGRDPAELLVSHNYVLIETAALVDRRLGLDAARVLLDGFVPALSVAFVDAPLHRLGVASYLAASRRRASLVDWISFELMRHRSIRRAFAFDADFRTEGFELVA
jgi:uncharacterized protein